MTKKADFADMLADGIPFGLIGSGITDDDICEAAHVCTVSASVKKASIDPRTGDLVMTVTVPPQHKWIALPLADAADRKLLIRVYAHGLTADTVRQSSRLAPDRPRSDEIRQRVLERRKARESGSATPER